MPISIERFTSQLVEARLLSKEELDAASVSAGGEQPQDAEQLARLLVRQKKLTAYQAQQVYSGKGKSLVLGNYVVLDKLGQGGMGMVLKAEHRRMERVVALKVLAPNIVKSPDALRRFQREVKAAAKLTHPNIVVAYDADEAAGIHFLVMEFVEGTDLSSLVKQQGVLSVQKALHCIQQVARGLEYAHGRGVVHRDVKPGNLLLDNDGTVKILDLGLARLESDGAAQSQLTNTGQVMGTVDYMAPEQALDSKQADARSDIYSLGVTLWYLLTGQSLYASDTVVKKILAHQRDPIPSLRQACPLVSAELEAVFVKMVAKSPVSRYQSMTDVLADLDRFLTGISSASPPDTSPGEDTRLSEFLRGQAQVGIAGMTAKVQKLSQPTTPSLEPTIAYQATQLGSEAVTREPNASEVTADPTVRMKRKFVKKQERRTQTRLPWLTVGGVTAGFLLLAGLLAFLVSRGGRTGGDTANKSGADEGPATSPAAAIASPDFSLEFDGQGDLLNDSSGHNHHGEIVGAKWVKTAVERPSPFDQLKKEDLSAATIKQVFGDKQPPAELVALLPAPDRDGKPGAFNHVTVAPDGSRFLVSGHTSPVQIVESATAKPVTMANTLHIVNSRLLDDGRSLAMVSSGGGFHLGDLITASQERKNVREGAPPSDASAFTSDGRRVFIGFRDGSVRQVETATGRTLSEFQPFTERLRYLRLSPDDRRLYLLRDKQERSGTILVTRDLASGKDSTFDLGALLARDYSMFWVHPNGKSLWLAEWYKTSIKRFDLGTQTLLPDVEAGELWRGFAIRDDGGQFVTLGPSGKLKVWDNATLRVTREISLPPASALGWSLTFAPDRRHLVVAQTDPGVAFVLRLESRDTRVATVPNNTPPAAVTKITPHEKFPVLKGHEGPIKRIRFLPDGNQFVSVARDGTARLWKVKTGEMVRQFASTGADKTLNNLAIAPDGKRLAMGGSSFRVYLFDIASGKLERFIQLKDLEHAAIGGLAFSADGASVFVGNVPGVLHEFQVSDGSLLSSPKVADERLAVIEPLPDNERVLVADWGQPSILLWHKTKQHVEQRFDWTEKYGSPRSISLLADGERFASAHSNGLVRIWSLKTGQELKRWTPHIGTAIASTDVISLHNDRWLLTLGDDKAIRLWDGKTFDKLDEETTEMLGTGQGAVSPDGRMLVTGAGWRLTTQSEYDEHHDLHVWRLPKPKL